MEPSHFGQPTSLIGVPLDGPGLGAKVRTLLFERRFKVCLSQMKEQYPISRNEVLMTASLRVQTELLAENRSGLSSHPTGTILPAKPKPVFISIKPSYVEALQALGYSESEAHFLYIVATHSGYFAARQFLAFTSGHWGKRTTTFWSKLHAKKHARTEYFPMNGKAYHVYSPKLYRQIGRENLRNRREHEFEYVQRRIGILDFVLSHPECRYLETEPEKLSYFCDQLKIPNHFLPSKIYYGQKTSQPTVRYFVDKFPMFFGIDSFSCSPVVTFPYLQGSEASLTEFVHHLKGYLPLFRQLSEFRFLCLARVDAHFEKAKELFNSVVTIPLGSDVSAELCRYFQICKAWDFRQYRAVTDADLIFRNEAKARFVGQRFEHLYRGWKAGRVTQDDIRQEFGGVSHPVTAHFATELLRRVGATEGDRDAKG